MIRSILKKANNVLTEHKTGVYIILYSLLHAALVYYALELGNKNPLLNGAFYTIINILTIFVLQSMAHIIVRRRWIATSITGIALVVLSIANYYTLMFRNSPISTQDIHNVGTTLSVIDSYHFPITAFVLGILIFFGLEIAVSVRLHNLEKGQKRPIKRTLLLNAGTVLFCMGFMHMVYFAENPIKPRNTFVWSWEDSYYRYGYAASSIEVFQNSVNMVNMPSGYSSEVLSAREETKMVKKTKGKTPDIIFILNETFYDMRDLLDIETDVEVMPFVDSLKHSGRTVVAGTGGGTNKSEYELLTSNSLELMPAITPFNYLNFDDANSIVSFAKELGYSTWGAHPAEALNYERGIVYPKLGFDQVLFREEFGEIEKYGIRPYATDEFCYEKLIRDYESMGEGPRLQYILTIQNHGGWDINEDSLDTVHTIKDFGEHTPFLNEFMSCVKRSDDAFKELTEYFENCGRDVIVCMVGDHAPSFATELVDSSSLDVTFALRSTPYAVWANFDISNYSIPKEISMPYIVPTVLDMAGVNLSPYYSHMLKLRDSAPVLTAFGLYKTKEGEIFGYSEATEHSSDINIYFDMVYNNVADSVARLEHVFKPKD